MGRVNEGDGPPHKTGQDETRTPGIEVFRRCFAATDRILKHTRDKAHLTIFPSAPRLLRLLRTAPFPLQYSSPTPSTPPMRFTAVVAKVWGRVCAPCLPPPPHRHHPRHHRRSQPRIAGTTGGGTTRAPMRGRGGPTRASLRCWLQALSWEAGRERCSACWLRRCAHAPSPRGMSRTSGTPASPRCARARRPCRDPYAPRSASSCVNATPPRSAPGQPRTRRPRGSSR